LRSRPPKLGNVPLSIAKGEQAVANRVIAPCLEGREKLTITRENATGLVKHEERLIQSVDDPLRLDMFAA